MRSYLLTYLRPIPSFFTKSEPLGVRGCRNRNQTYSWYELSETEVKYRVDPIIVTVVIVKNIECQMFHEIKHDEVKLEVLLGHFVQ